MKRNLELLISSLEKDPQMLISRMNLECDAVIVNQGNSEGKSAFETEEGHMVQVTESCARGVGLSRNTALDAADSEIILFSDDDIVYSKGYASSVLRAFDSEPDADIIMFNVNVREERRTYWTEKRKRVRKWTVGRYPAYAAAARLDSIRKSGLKFSLLFGGGAEYSCGEDSLFFMDCLKAGLKIVAVPVVIGTEEPRDSTWFRGYNDKFFRDRGVLLYFLYGGLAMVWAVRFVIAKKKLYGDSVRPREALRLLKEGIKTGRMIKKNSPGER